MKNKTILSLKVFKQSVRNRYLCKCMTHWGCFLLTSELQDHAHFPPNNYIMQSLIQSVFWEPDECEDLSPRGWNITRRLKFTFKLSLCEYTGWHSTAGRAPEPLCTFHSTTVGCQLYAGEICRCPIWISVQFIKIEACVCLWNWGVI